jgi:hypothetical protein
MVRKDFFTPLEMTTFLETHSWQGFGTCSEPEADRGKLLISLPVFFLYL